MIDKRNSIILLAILIVGATMAGCIGDEPETTTTLTPEERGIYERIYSDLATDYDLVADPYALPSDVDVIGDDPS